MKRSEYAGKPTVNGPAWAAGAAAFLVLFLAYQVAKSLSGR